MTQDEIAAAVADVIQEHMALALAPMMTRLAVAETQVAQCALQTQSLGELRDRVVVVETKALIPPTPIAAPSPPVDMSPVLERLASMEARIDVLGDVRDRVITVETKMAQPVDAPSVDVAPPVDVSPLFERVAAAEARLSVLGDMRDRLITVETKAAQPVQVPVSEPPPAVDLSPILERVASTEARLDTLGDLRDRVVTVEVKAAQRPPDVPAVDLSPLVDRISAVEVGLRMKASETEPLLAKLADLSHEQSALRERIAVAEMRPLMPGPAGQAGRDGEAGKDGKDGVDGLGFDDLGIAQHADERTLTIKATRGLQTKEIGTVTFPSDIYRGVYVEGRQYERGDGVTYGGSAWHCNEPTTTKPGDGSKAWTLKVKRGRDGKDGRDAMSIPVVSVGKH